MVVVSGVVAAVAFLLAAMWAAVGVLGVRGALRRNRWFGVRTDATVHSEETFRLANRVAAPGTLGAAAILFMGGVLTLLVDGGWSVLFGAGAIVAAFVVVGLVSGMGVRAAELAPTDDDCGPSGCATCTLRGMCATDAKPAPKV